MNLAKRRKKSARDGAATGDCLDEATIQDIEDILLASGGSLAFSDLSEQVPGLALAKLKARYPIIFIDGKAIVQISEERYEENLKEEILNYLDSCGGLRSVYKTTKKFSIDRPKIRAMGFEVRREMVLSPTCAADMLSKDELDNPLGEERIEKIIDLLNSCGGILKYEEIGIAVGNVTKAQLSLHFDVVHYDNGSCEVRLPGTTGTLEELRGEAKPELVPPLEDALLEEITSVIRDRGGSIDSDELRDMFPEVKKQQLREHFDVELTRKVKETGKRFYSVSLRDKKAKRAKVSVLTQTDKQISSFLGSNSKFSDGKGKGDIGKALGRSKGGAVPRIEVLHDSFYWKGSEMTEGKTKAKGKKSYNGSGQRHDHFAKGKGAGKVGKQHDWWARSDGWQPILW